MTGISRAATVAVTLALATPGAGAAHEGSTLITARLPRVEYRGGPFVRTPRVVTVTFRGDDAALVARLARFGDVITRTAWWRAVTDGYCAEAGDCIGDGAGARHVELDATLGADVHANDVAALLERAAGDGRFGVLDADTVLMVYLPAGVALRDAFVPRYCGAGPRGLHRALRLPSGAVALAILPRCGDEAVLTATASHELLEAVTNPDPARRGFAFVPSSAHAGFTAAGVEPVDPCGILTGGARTTTDSGFTVQRAWSNGAAARGDDPCVPSPDEGPYLALVPDAPTLRLRAPGERATVTLTAAADGPTGTWTIAGSDLAGAQDGTRYVDVALDRTTVRPGDVVVLTVTAVRMAPKERTVVGVVSTLDGASFLWPIAIVMR
jgi:hypothetical protein